MKRRSLLASLTAGALAASSRPADAQTLGSSLDPQLASLAIEAKLPTANILTATPNALGFPPELLGAFEAGALELRARVEYNRPARLFRIWQLILPPSSPYPLPQAPAQGNAAVGTGFDIAPEYVAWFDYPATDGSGLRRTLTVSGRTLNTFAGPYPFQSEPVSLTLSMDDSFRFRMVSLTIAGVFTALASNITGSVEFEPGRNINFPIRG